LTYERKEGTEGGQEEAEEVAGRGGGCGAERAGRGRGQRQGRDGDGRESDCGNHVGRDRKSGKDRGEREVVSALGSESRPGLLQRAGCRKQGFVSLEFGALVLDEKRVLSALPTKLVDLDVLGGQLLLVGRVNLILVPSLPFRLVVPGVRLRQLVLLLSELHAQGVRLRDRRSESPVEPALRFGRLLDLLGEPCRDELGSSLCQLCVVDVLVTERGVDDDVGVLPGHLQGLCASGLGSATTGSSRLLLPSSRAASE